MEFTTMTQLHDWYMSQSASVRSKDVYIGLNSDKVGAKGIYIQSGDYIVYENAKTGPRVIFYKGADEAEAVTHCQKLLEEDIQNKRAKKEKQDAGFAANVANMFIPNSDFLEQENLPIPKQFYLLILVVILLIVLIIFGVDKISKCGDDVTIYQESMTVVEETATK